MSLFPCLSKLLFVSLQFATLFPSTNLKHHFNVSNSYVILKLKLILFPWTHKPWVRRIRRTDNGQSEWQPPRDDINSPDLYIPGLLLSLPFIIISLSSLDSHGHRHLHPSHCHSQRSGKELQPQGASSLNQCSKPIHPSPDPRRVRLPRNCCPCSGLCFCQTRLLLS